MSVFVVGAFQDVDPAPELARYQGEIGGTLAPFGGRFTFRAPTTSMLEGAFEGVAVAIEFPDEASARSWYASEAYQAIAPLRKAHSSGWIALVEGADEAERR